MDALSVILLSFVFVGIGGLLFLSIFKPYESAGFDSEDLNDAFLSGYEAGKRDGYYEALKEKVTPNMLRQYLGLEPINNEKEKK